jgi:hypothetical protein
VSSIDHFLIDIESVCVYDGIYPEVFVTADISQLYSAGALEEAVQAGAGGFGFHSCAAILAIELWGIYSQ